MILYMTTVPLAKARAQLSKLVDDAVATHVRTEITRNGARAAVLLGADDYDALIETLDILADADLVADISTSLDELRRGETLTTDDVLATLPPARRGRR